MTEPRLGHTKPSRSASTVDFPEPLGPTRKTFSPGSITRQAPSSTGSCLPGRSTRTERRATGTSRGSGTLAASSSASLGAAGPDRPDLSPAGTRPTGPDRTDLSPATEAACACPSAITANACDDATRPWVLSWNSALARRSGRNTSGATIRTASAAHRCTEPSSNRRPSGTATRATDIDPNVSSTRAERNATRSVFRLDSLRASLARAILSLCSALRPNARSTGNPWNRSATWRPSASTWRQRSLASAMLVRPTSAPNTGKRATTTARTSAESQSSTPTATSIANGARAASTKSGKQRPRYRSSASRPGPARVATSPGVATYGTAPGAGACGMSARVAKLGLAGRLRGASETAAGTSRARSSALAREAPSPATTSPASATSERTATAPPSRTNQYSLSPARAAGIALASRRASATACTTTAAVDTIPRATEMARLNRSAGSTSIRLNSMARARRGRAGGARARSVPAPGVAVVGRSGTFRDGAATGSRCP